MDLKAMFFVHVIPVGEARIGMFGTVPFSINIIHALHHVLQISSDVFSILYFDVIILFEEHLLP